MAAISRPPMTIPVGILSPAIPKKSITEGIEGINPRGTHIKNGKAMQIPATRNRLLANLTSLRFDKVSSWCEKLLS